MYCSTIKFRDIDELIISEFYILFNLVLFRFSFILFYYYFLFEQFTLRFNKIYFRNEYWVEQSWSKRKRIRSWFGLEKCKDSTKNMMPQVRSLARPMPNVARPCHPLEPLLLLFLLLQATLFCSLSPQFLVGHSSIIVA